MLEGIPAIVLFGPLLFPIARQIGVHEVHYAMVVILAMGIGLFAPPFGVGYYAACAIGRVNPDEGMRPISATCGAAGRTDRRRGGAVDLDRVFVRAVGCQRRYGLMVGRAHVEPSRLGACRSG